MINERWAVGGMRFGRGNRSSRRIPTVVPLCPPQIPWPNLGSNPDRPGGKPATVTESSKQWIGQADISAVMAYWGTIPTFAWREQGKARKPSVRTILPLSCARGGCRIPAHESQSPAHCRRLRSVVYYVCYGPYSKVAAPSPLGWPSQPNRCLDDTVACAFVPPTQRLQVIQNKIIRNIYDTRYINPHSARCQKLKWRD
jgi:hypothetical protein